MAENLQNLCYRAGLTGIQEQRVSTFSQRHGDDASVEVLQKILKIREHQQANGLRQDGAQYLWNKHSGDYRKVAGNRKREREQKAAKERNMAAYRASIKSGYKPNKETLLAQIEAQYTDGVITKQEYDWGIRGLELVYGYVEAAKALTEDEEGMREFGF